MFNATFSNISVISWWAVLLMEETGETHRLAASKCQLNGLYFAYTICTMLINVGYYDALESIVVI